jgi:hypothetical protein
MMRYTLGINNKTSIDAIYAELGRYPVYNDMIIKSLKYEQRLESANPKDLVSKAYKESKFLNQEGKTITWMSQINYIKETLNINHTDSPHRNKYKATERALQTRFRDNWKLRLFSDESKNKTTSTGNKLRTFRKLKNIYKYESYLEISSSKLRKNLCRFRISAHKLNIETGRHKNIPLKDRLCTKCNLQQIEDEEHALITCPFYNIERQTLLQIVNNSNNNFSQLPDEAKFIWLMANEDSDIMYALAKFINIFF